LLNPFALSVIKARNACMSRALHDGEFPLHGPPGVAPNGTRAWR